MAREGAIRIVEVLLHLLQERLREPLFVFVPQQLRAHSSVKLHQRARIAAAAVAFPHDDAGGASA